MFLILSFSMTACSENDEESVEIVNESNSVADEDVNLFRGVNQYNPPVEIDDSLAAYNNSTKSLLFTATGLANKDFGKMGPYQVATNDELGDCNKYFGIVVQLLQGLGMVDNTIKCNNAFPYGFNSAISTHVYYPANIKDINHKLPVVNFAGGFISNTANYYQLAQLWASHGYIVSINSNFINVLPTMHLVGFGELSRMNKDQNSLLYNKVDLSRTIVTGHSEGGGASLLTGSISNETLKKIDSNINVLGVMSIEGSPIAIGNTVKYPTLFLAGNLDFIVLPWIHNLWQFNTLPKPAWSAVATTATHFSPTMELRKNEFAGITVAYLKYLAENDANAKSYFVGKNYKLTQDSQYIQSFLNPLRVKRNVQANNLK